jgi:methylthioribose-1-phosphate isomerase
MIDQRLLPAEEVYPVFRTYAEVAWAIKEMVVRGAPAIGVAAAMGIALGARDTKTDNAGEFDQAFDQICEVIGSTRPTAVNLFWAIERMRRLQADLRNENRPLDEIRARLIAEANLMFEEDVEANRAMGRHGAGLIPDGATVLTHCNAGALATAGYGTALGVIRAAVEAGKRVAVFADETRPFLQGARLTAWELSKENIPVTLITDNMAGHFMKRGRIDCVVVGADRIAANGDFANKIGTYSLAVLARHHKIPFYVAAPYTTVDVKARSGADIPVEHRAADEVRGSWSPRECRVHNPAFDVTPGGLVTAFILDSGAYTFPYRFV